MTRFAALTIAAFVPCALGTAQAADMTLPVKAPAQVLANTWGGFYVGGHGAYATARVSAPDPDGLGINSNSAKGWLAGGQLGYNWQMGMWVVGVEGDGNWGDVNRKVDDGAGTTAKFTVDRTATATGRFGYAFGDALIYGKGGAAWTHEKLNVVAAGAGTGTMSQDRTGWVIGGGLEYAFFNNWSAKGEYNYLDMGTETPIITTSPGLVVTPVATTMKIHMFKFGINYRFR